MKSLMCLLFIWWIRMNCVTAYRVYLYGFELDLLEFQ